MDSCSLLPSDLAAAARILPFRGSIVRSIYSGSLLYREVLRVVIPLSYSHWSTICPRLATKEMIETQTQTSTPPDHSSHSTPPPLLSRPDSHYHPRPVKLSQGCLYRPPARLPVPGWRWPIHLHHLKCLSNSSRVVPGSSVGDAIVSSFCGRRLSPHALFLHEDFQVRAAPS